MNIDITKIANVILYMLHKKVTHLNDKKLLILLFLMDYNHKNFCGKTIFKEEYIKNSRHPEPVVMGELFDIIANNEDLEEGDARLYLIQELLDYLDIEVVKKNLLLSYNLYKWKRSLMKRFSLKMSLQLLIKWL